MRFDSDFEVREDGQSILVIDNDGPAVIGEPGSGELQIPGADPWATHEAEWRWRQDGNAVDLQNERGRFPGRYRGTIRGNTIRGVYEEPDGRRGSFVMTRAF